VNAQQLLELIIRPALARLARGWTGARNIHTPAAEALVLGTAMAESGLRYVKQLGTGPALGLWQIEPATEADVHENYLAYRPIAQTLVNDVRGVAHPMALAGNMPYGAMMCRLVYYRAPEPVPALGADLDGTAKHMATFWKRRYNTAQGKGKAEDVVPVFRAALGIVCGP
jgi:hypothetical protein